MSKKNNQKSSKKRAVPFLDSIIPIFKIKLSQYVAAGGILIISSAVGYLSHYFIEGVGVGKIVNAHEERITTVEKKYDQIADSIDLLLYKTQIIEDLLKIIISK